MVGANKPDAEPAAPTCGGGGACKWFQQPKIADDGVNPLHDVHGVYRYGNCIRFPRIERKQAMDTCGEHSPLPTKEN